ncbi:MAG TPA: hypothetical protein EYP30_01470 [Archaeoglobaceae archaeon]|nr:hypothetical protein [Archaeoglobaceae archaeon]
MLFIHNHQFEKRCNDTEKIVFTAEEMGDQDSRKLILRADSDQSLKEITDRLLERGYVKKDTMAANIKFEDDEKAVLMRFFIKGMEKMILYYFNTGEIMLGCIKRGKFRILESF